MWKFMYRLDWVQSSIIYVNLIRMQLTVLISWCLYKLGEF